MDFESAMKSPEIYDLRLVSGDSWMYWDETNSEWVVLKCAPRQKRNSVMYRGESISDAIDALVK